MVTSMILRTLKELFEATNDNEVRIAQSSKVFRAEM